MKKSYLSMALIAAVSVFTGCTVTKAFKSQTASLKLNGNPTTGYSWYYTLSSEDVVTIDEDIQYQGSDGVVGAPSVFNYSISSVKPGTTQINFEYKRIWETVPPIETCSYEITVDQEGKISVSEILKK